MKIMIYHLQLTILSKNLGGKIVFSLTQHNLFNTSFHNLLKSYNIIGKRKGNDDIVLYSYQSQLVRSINCKKIINFTT